MQTLLVNQIDTVNEDIVHFEDNSNVVFSGKNGNTNILGDLTVQNNLVVNEYKYGKIN